MTKIEMGKQYRTRDGREVRIYAVDGEKGAPIHGAFKASSGWVSMSWLESGETYKCHQYDYDLIEVKPRIKRDVWLNLYKNDDVGVAYYKSKQIADLNAYSGRIACVKITIDVEEGEGL